MTKLKKHTLIKLFYKVISKGTNKYGDECLYIYEEKGSAPIDYIGVGKGLFVKYAM